MTELYPPIEPHDTGLLEVGQGNQVYWEVSGNPNGRPALVVHGGPGSGASPGWRRYFDPAVYRIVLFDQRGCGRSLPDAGDPAVSLQANTTQYLIADMELLRAELGIDRWLLLGGSWGATLILAYAERYPERVAAIVLMAVTNSRPREIEWLTRDVGRLFPEAWQRFRDGVPPEDRDGNLSDAYARLLGSPDPAVRDQAARDWCDWEDWHGRVHADSKHDSRYDDPVFRMRFARLVTHYFRHAGFLEDGIILREATNLAGIPGVLLHGRLDLGSPLDTAWALAKAWPDAELIVGEQEGHGFRDRSAALDAVARLATDGRW
ncbi:MAG: prolyl aminopeptidase [Actinomycetota bacterium]|nr:prolyl aminopeptidase [Actinomycetota bacterium]MDQ2958076.1 prolyl aminopeptidase [Actinomycetota bacterium]